MSVPSVTGNISKLFPVSKRQSEPVLTVRERGLNTLLEACERCSDTVIKQFLSNVTVTADNSCLKCYTDMWKLEKNVCQNADDSPQPLK